MARNRLQYELVRAADVAHGDRPAITGRHRRRQRDGDIAAGRVAVDDLTAIGDQDRVIGAARYNRERRNGNRGIVENARIERPGEIVLRLDDGPCTRTLGIRA